MLCHPKHSGSADTWVLDYGSGLVGRQRASGIEATDLDGDGLDDLVLSNRTSASLSTPA